MHKKIFISIITTLLIIGICLNTNAVETTKFQIIKKTSDPLTLENNQGTLTKGIVEQNLETGEFTIELTLTNTKTNETGEMYDSTEVIFVIDNSNSMETKITSTQTRRDVIISAAKDFAKQLLQETKNTKIGLTYYYGFDQEDDEDKTPVQTYGTLDTAKIITNLTDDETQIQNALDKLSTMEYNAGTNTDAGLQRAKTMFSNNNKAQKFIILLSDGVPYHATGVTIQYGGDVGPTEEEVQADVNNRTKETIQKIGDSNINLITMLAGLEDLEEKENNILKTVFGTIEEPTAGTLYNIKDSEISSIIKDKIYTEVLEKIQGEINDINITDYFPQEIIDNFTISEVEITNEIAGITTDLKEDSITWHIDTLKSGESVKLRYKIKIKDIKNNTIINKIQDTNEKVELTYSDKEEKQYKQTMTSSPQIKLTETKNEEEEKKEQPTPSPKEDDKTIAQEIYPYTGEKILIIALIITLGIATYVFIKYKSYKDVK